MHLFELTLVPHECCSFSLQCRYLSMFLRCRCLTFLKGMAWALFSSLAVPFLCLAWHCTTYLNLPTKVPKVINVVALTHSIKDCTSVGEAAIKIATHVDTITSKLARANWLVSQVMLIVTKRLQGWILVLPHFILPFMVFIFYIWQRCHIWIDYTHV